MCPDLPDGNGLFGDSGLIPTRLCVSACQTPNTFADVANSRTCQPKCTFNTTYISYANDQTM